MKKELALDELRMHLKYVPETGHFIWIGKQFGVTKGKIAGYIGKLGYRHIQINGKIEKGHRLSWLWNTGSFPDKGIEIDHIDGNKDNNMFDNLRTVTRSQNCKNTKIRSTNKSGCVGVHLVKRSGKYQARINDFNGKRIVLGTFVSFEDAVKARKDAEVLYGYHPNHGRIS